MRGSMRLKRGSSVPVFLAGASIVFISALAGTQAIAADLDRPPPPPVALQSPPCKLVPMPEGNLGGDTVRFRPNWVCVSRGLYADTLPPPPPLRRPWWWW